MTASSAREPAHEWLRRALSCICLSPSSRLDGSGASASSANSSSPPARRTHWQSPKAVLRNDLGKIGIKITRPSPPPASTRTSRTPDRKLGLLNYFQNIAGEPAPPRALSAIKSANCAFMPAKRAKTFRDAPAVLFRHWPAGREHPGQRAARSDQLGAIAVAVVEHADELRAQGLRREPQQIIACPKRYRGHGLQIVQRQALSHDPAPPPPRPRPFCRQVGDCVFTPPALAKVVGDGAGALSRHWPAEERPYQRATISGGDFVQIVAVGVVKQFEQCPFREVLARFVVHAPKRYADRITNRSTADHPVPPRVPAAPAAAGPGPGRARRRDRRAVALDASGFQRPFTMGTRSANWARRRLLEGAIDAGARDLPHPRDAR
jgi:hypothetical protein